MAKQTGVQKILVGGAAGALIGGAATYAATHQKQTRKIFKEIAKATDEAVKRIDTEKVRELGDVALSRVMKTKTAKKAQKQAANGMKQIAKKATPTTKHVKKTSTKRRKAA